MSEKAKTTIAIRKPVYTASKSLAESEDRDFSFVVERALIKELRACGIPMDGVEDLRAKIVAAAEEVGPVNALSALQQLVRKKKRAA